MKVSLKPGMADLRPDGADLRLGKADMRIDLGIWVEGELKWKPKNRNVWHHKSLVPPGPLPKREIVCANFIVQLHPALRGTRSPKNPSKIDIRT